MPDNSEQLHLIHEENPAYTPEQQTEKNAYRERLRTFLEDPAARQIEGFPIGENEAILALSDPPYYTACPNPFLEEIIEKWQNTPKTADGQKYHREPFAADVSEGKNDPIYNAHSYHTKVPHKAIMRYILHYTEPGDIIFDGFCGTGMTGVAAQLCGDKKVVESLGYRVAEDGTVFDGDKSISTLGGRNAVLVDLSPAATFIAYNYNAPVDIQLFEQGAIQILNDVEKECGWMYETWHPDSESQNRVKGKINYTVWSDIFICPECGNEYSFWEIAVDKSTGFRKKKAEYLECPKCHLSAPLNQIERAWITKYDPYLSETVRTIKRVPILINYSIGKQRFEKKPDPIDLETIDKIESLKIPHWIPINRMPVGDEAHRNDDVGITYVHHFYTARSLWTWAYLMERIESSTDKLRSRLHFWAQSVGLGQTLLNRYLAASYSQVNRYLKGTLYIAPFIAEVSPRYSLSGKTKVKIQPKLMSSAIYTGSTTKVLLPDNSIDYIFTDPPFGANIDYSDLNFIWESWLKVTTNNRQEAVVSRAQNKNIPEYQKLMIDCFKEYYRLLKPGRWMTVEFHNSRNSIWNSIQESLLRVGFIVADVHTLDKKQETMQQMTSTSAVKQDLVISAYKPNIELEERFRIEAGSADGAWEFVRYHLSQLPIVMENNGKIEAVAERQAYLLFDRMVAFHIQRGASVPLSSGEFYAGLHKRFIERDGMFFLADQVPQYDSARLRLGRITQLALFIKDEKSTIQWLRQRLDPNLGGEPQTRQDITPDYQRQLHQDKYEILPELDVLLDQNFLQDEDGKWYTPDPSKISDLEKVRSKALLREFGDYLEGTGRLRQFRSEAVRVGFGECWKKRDYDTIIKVAERLPESVLHEDPDLLMYYDNATLRNAG